MSSDMTAERHDVAIPEAAVLMGVTRSTPAPPTKAWLLTEKRKDGRIVNEAIALTNEAATAWVRDPNMEFGQARSSLPLKIVAAAASEAAPSPPVPWNLVRELSMRCRELVFAWAGGAAGEKEPLGPKEINDTFKCLQAAADYLDNFVEFGETSPPTDQEK
jgi:hypothetical protein